MRYTVELNCPADNIPETIELDLAEAEMNDSIHISEVTLPEGVEPVISDRLYHCHHCCSGRAEERGIRSSDGEEGEDGETEGEAGAAEESGGEEEGGEE